MITWHDILSQYHFQTTSYEEHCDPSNLKHYFVEVIPKYPFQALNPNFNFLVVHSYHDMLLPMLPSDDVLYDFTVSVILTHISTQHTGRQHIYNIFILVTFIVYLVCTIIRILSRCTCIMLGKTGLTIDLRADYFVSPKHIFLWQLELL